MYFPFNIQWFPLLYLCYWRFLPFFIKIVLFIRWISGNPVFNPRCDDESSSSNSSPTPRKFRSKLAPLAFGFSAKWIHWRSRFSLFVFPTIEIGWGLKFEIHWQGGEVTSLIFSLIFFAGCSTFEEHIQEYSPEKKHVHWKSMVGSWKIYLLLNYIMPLVFRGVSTICSFANHFFLK